MRHLSIRVTIREGPLLYKCDLRAVCTRSRARLTCHARRRLWARIGLDAASEALAYGWVGADFAPFIDSHVADVSEYTSYVILDSNQKMIRVEVSATPPRLPTSADETPIAGNGKLFGQLLVRDDFAAQIGLWQLGQEPSTDQIADVANSFQKLNDADLTSLSETARANLNAQPEIDDIQVGETLIVRRGLDPDAPIAICLREGGTEACRSHEASPAGPTESRIVVRSVIQNRVWKIFGYRPSVSPGDNSIGVCRAESDGSIVAAVEGLHTDVNGVSYFIVEMPAAAEFSRLCIQRPLHPIQRRPG